MGKGCGSNFNSRLQGGALSDETENGCEGDHKKEGNLATEQFYVLSSLLLFLIDQETFATVKEAQSGIPARFCDRQKMVGQLHASQ